MKKVHYTRYGDSNVLKLVQTHQPKVKNNTLLVKVAYASLNAIDWKNRTGDFRFVSGIFKPHTQQGFDLVGTVEDVTFDNGTFQKGNRIVAQLGNFSGGALSEYVLVPIKDAVKLPETISYKDSAALPMAVTTAWLALFKEGKLKKGHKVLINGGSSGVGHMAIQIAKAYGAEVTSVSSGKNLAFCKKLGADHVIDYQKEDFHDLYQHYDIVFDVVFNTTHKRVKHQLKKNWIYVGTTPSVSLLSSMLFSKQARFVAVKPQAEVLKKLLGLMEHGKLKVQIDKEFTMDEIVHAHDYIEQSRTRGKLLICVKQHE